MITSKSNEQIKNIKKLMTSKKARDEQGVFVVEGEKMVLEAPDALLEKIYVTGSKLAELEEKHGDFKNVETVSDDVMKHISDTVTPQGVVAVVKKPFSDVTQLMKDVDTKPELLLVLLDDIRDPGNMGTIIRTAEAAGADYVIMSDASADVFSPKVVRSTMGSIFRVKLIVGDIVGITKLLMENDVDVYAACLDSSSDYKKIKYGSRNAFIIGNEARGISDEVLKLPVNKIKIEMKGEVESLNAAISLAVLLFGIDR